MAPKVSVDISDLHLQLKIANRLLAAGLKEKMKQNQLISLLASTGASPTEIADVLDTTPATVSVALNRLKRQPKRASNEKNNKT